MDIINDNSSNYKQTILHQPHVSQHSDIKIMSDTDISMSMSMSVTDDSKDIDCKQSQDMYMYGLC